MEMESETLSATMADTLKVSETRETTTDPEEDSFYDCEDTLPGEDGHTDVKRTEREHRDKLEPDYRTENERLENINGADGLCLDNTSEEDSEGHEDSSAEQRHDSLTRDLDPENDNDEEQERWERFVETDEQREGDSDSEFKEETVKVNEYDEEYLRELEKDLTEEEKEVSIIIQLLFFMSFKIYSSGCTIFHTIDILTFFFLFFKLQSRRKESLELKEKGNTQFKSGGKTIPQSGINRIPALHPFRIIHKILHHIYSIYINPHVVYPYDFLKNLYTALLLNTDPS